ncbi:PLCXc domain-containing protein [Fusarium keratoplasticum]|nr:PLCXc domain-containing protein [Fusarium keratoplasticum]
MCIFYLLFTFAPCLVYGSCYRGYLSAFSFDANLAHNPTWMASIPDEVPLSSLSVPGTHDTMTYEIGDEFLECQNWNLSTQLNAGVRYFDIRARLRENELHIYHAWGYTGFSFQDVLHDMTEFLDSNPSETIIMRLKQEGGPIGEGNTRTFEDAFNQYSFGDHLYNYSSTEPLPLLGDLRSKIFVLQNFPDKEALELAATARHDNKALYLAHLSASVGVKPIEAAAGPMNRTISGMNDMTGQWIEDFEGNPEATRTGIVIIDFPGQKLIDAIIRWNRPLEKGRRWSRSSLLS